MKKLILSTLVVLGSVTLLTAQDLNNDPQLGIKGGGNISTIKLTDKVPAGYSNGWIFRPVAGLFGNIPVSKRASIAVEGLYSGMGGVVKRGNNLKDLTQRLGYISLPVMLKIHASRSLKFLGGVQWESMLRAKRIDDQFNTSTFNDDEVKNHHFGLNAGLEFWPASRFHIGARYIHGLSRVWEADPVTRNRGIQLSLGFVIGKKAAVVAPLAAIVPAVVAKPIDTDNDGVADADDKCPAVAGLAKYNGCPIPDTDGDGVNDEQDKCPAVAGLAKYNGCPIPDTDGDGINDEEDECPKVAGVATYRGCPIPDTDGDGVNDEEDKCKTIAGLAENNGCPKIDFNANNVQFLSGSSTLTSAAKAELNKLANILNKDYPLVRVGIEGHTDNTGKADANLLLSEKRAAAVKAYLVGRKVDIDRLDAVGYGQDQPIADNATAQGKAQNRRVAFKISEQ